MSAVRAKSNGGGVEVNIFERNNGKGLSLASMVEGGRLLSLSTERRSSPRGEEQGFRGEGKTSGVFLCGKKKQRTFSTGVGKESHARGGIRKKGR